MDTRKYQARIRELEKLVKKLENEYRSLFFQKNKKKYSTDVVHDKSENIPSSAQEKKMFFPFDTTGE